MRGEERVCERVRVSSAPPPLPRRRGIPVVKHPKHGVYVPEMVMGR
jgi:hypothetical protein